MLALLDPSQLLLCKGVTLTALPLLQHLFQHYSDSSSKHGLGPFTGAQPHTSAWGGHRGTGNSAELARGAGFGRQVLLCQGENSPWPGEHHGPVPGVSPWLSGAALCPRGVVGRTLLSQLGQADPPCLPASPRTDILFTATVGRAQAYTRCQGVNLLCDCRGSLALAGIQTPKAGRGAVCAPGQPYHLHGQCHPLSAGTATQGSPECCHISPEDPHPWHSHRMSEKGDARHREQNPGSLLPSSNLGYQQPHSRTPKTRDGAGDCRGRAAP